MSKPKYRVGEILEEKDRPREFCKLEIVKIVDREYLCYHLWEDSTYPQKGQPPDMSVYAEKIDEIDEDFVRVLDGLDLILDKL